MAVGPSPHRRANLAADNELAFSPGGQRGGNGAGPPVGGGGDGGTGSWTGSGVSAHVFWPSESSAAVAAWVWSVCVKIGGGGEGNVVWEERGPVEVSNRRVP